MKHTSASSSLLSPLIHTRFTLIPLHHRQIKTRAFETLPHGDQVGWNFSAF
eukprot:m.220970 g.220970  ORF g.220970 m.220970 type:complete len:51 (-) comp15685_c0_seq1:1195-1347(-)